VLQKQMEEKKRLQDQDKRRRIQEEERIER
jgi:hypothetical protein